MPDINDVLVRPLVVWEIKPPIRRDTVRAQRGRVDGSSIKILPCPLDARRRRGDPHLGGNRAPKIARDATMARMIFFDAAAEGVRAVSRTPDDSPLLVCSRESSEYLSGLCWFRRARIT